MESHTPGPTDAAGGIVDTATLERGRIMETRSPRIFTQQRLVSLPECHRRSS